MRGSLFFKNRIVLLDCFAAALAFLCLLAAFFGSETKSTLFLMALSLLLGLLLLFLLFFIYRKALKTASALDSAAQGTLPQTARKLRSASLETEAFELVPSDSLKKGDLFLVRAGEQFPRSGEIIKGTAAVDESAMTGESAPVIREQGGNRRMVTRGTVLLSDSLIVRVGEETGAPRLSGRLHTFMEGEGTESSPKQRQKMPLLLLASAVCSVLPPACLLLSGRVSSVPGLLFFALMGFLSLTPLLPSVFFRAANLRGMNRLRQLHVLPKELRILQTLGRLSRLFIGKRLIYGEQEEGQPKDAKRPVKSAPLPGIREKLEAIRRMKIGVILMTEEPAANAAELAAAAGADGFIPEITVQGRLEAIRAAQRQGDVCGMLGTSLSDAPALAQADVAIAMENSAEEAKEAANLIDHDSSPEKIADIIRAGKETRRFKQYITAVSSVFELLKILVLLLPLLHFPPFLMLVLALCAAAAEALFLQLLSAYIQI